MKLTVALCLLLAVSCSAYVTYQDVSFQPFLHIQEKAMRTLINAHTLTDDPEVLNKCFNQYLTDQNGVLMDYNKAYNGCVTRAQTDKNELTALSQEQRTDLLDRSDNMCNNLKSCETIIDGLDFFNCYRERTADSYKVMFTLNSDANSQYNTIQAKYAVINTDLTACADTARFDYAHNLDKCDTDFNICIGLDETTEEPTDKPTTAAPVTNPPVTDAPVTNPPVTDAPVTNPPVTDAPVTNPPVTDAPVTNPPVTDAPVTNPPVTDAPVTNPPVTDAPVTNPPVTDAPVTDAPVTDAPVTNPPVTDAPVTDAPVTNPPVTDAPVTNPPVTDAPVTDAPTSTLEPIITTERSPEEDLKMLPRSLQAKLEKLIRLF